MATPNAPPSWRIVLNVPEARPMCSRPTAPTTALCAGGMAIDTPAPATVNGATICA
jgi:hypothetical protein